MSSEFALEMWLPIPGYDGIYEVSTEGRVRSFHSGAGRILKPLLAGSPWDLRKHVNLSLSGVVRKRKISQLVLEAFVGPRPSPKHHACHKNDNRFDDRLVNLRWDTALGNMADRIENGTSGKGASNPRARLSKENVLEITKRLDAGERQQKLADDFGVGQPHISRIKLKQAWDSVLGEE